MDENMKDLLNEEIKTQIRSLSEFEIGSQEMGAAIDDLVKLYKLDLEERRVENDAKEKEKNREIEDISKKVQAEAQRVDRFINVGIAAAEIILPLIFYGVWMRRGFKFEENGTYTSTTFRNLFNRFRPTKK